ncbi:MAG: hypothetical protein GEU98_14850 [Pseudonocardiaceae bacterium]|nr:hypothetical protein [Pseudonocardiaceae bacterium]
MSLGNEDPGTPPQDTGPPDEVETDPAALNSSEDLDEDRLHVDPLEKGVEPPERWSAADREEMTPFEEGRGQDIEHRLAEERPDVREATIPQRPVGATPATDLDETIDYVTEDPEPVAPDEPARETSSAATRRGQAADEAGGSMAETIRTPDEPE